MPSSFWQSVKIWGTSIFTILMLINIGLQGYKYFANQSEGGRTKSLKLQMCPEPIKVISYELASTTLTIIIQNNAEVALDGSIQVWMYDKDGVFLGKSLLFESHGTLPGQKTKTWFLIKDGSAKVVLCSMNPMSPLLQSNWKLQNL